MRFSAFSLSSCSPSPFLHHSSLSNSMASLSSASISSSRPRVLLQSSITSNNGLKPSIASWRSTQRVPLRLRISCAAKPETVDKVCAIVKKQLALPDTSEVTGDSKFTALGADSLDTVEIVMGLEEEFGISVEEESAQTITTVQDAADLIEKLLEK